MGGGKEKRGRGQKWGRAAAVRSPDPEVADSGVATWGPILGRAPASPSLARTASFSGAAQDGSESALRIAREMEGIQRMVKIAKLRALLGV